MRNPAYAVALADWLACAYAGAGERAARAVQTSGDDLLTRVAFAATAGHVHDFDDTFSHGVQAARLARGGARVDERAVRGELGFDAVFGAPAVTAYPGDPAVTAYPGGPSVTAGPGAATRLAIDRNWIKLYPSCLGTHSP